MQKASLAQEPSLSPKPSRRSRQLRIQNQSHLALVTQVLAQVQELPQVVQQEAQPAPPELVPYRQVHHLALEGMAAPAAQTQSKRHRRKQARRGL